MGEWPEGTAKGIIDEAGAFSTQPLQDYMDNAFKTYGPVKDRKVVWNSADVNSGAYVQFNETTSDPVKAVLSSGAMPFVFPP